MTSEQYTPEEFIQAIDAVLPKVSRPDQVQLVAHARAWATVSHDGEIPLATELKLSELEDQWL